jgi:NAD(P)H dehydrogenase (quinone)
MILVSAATGEFGRLVVDRLLEGVPAAELAVAVRNPGKAADISARGIDVRQGDYDDQASLRTAFSGVDALLFVSAPVIDSGRLEQHQNVVTAAKDAGVGLLAYTSGLGADFVEEGVLTRSTPRCTSTPACRPRSR